jgi:putative DNA primase/helicase
MTQPDHKLFRKLSEQFSLIRLKGKVPIEKGWEKYCELKRSFNEIGFQPGDNAGIACGPASGLIVLDVDSWPKFEESGRKIEPSFSVKTGGKGTHFYFRYPTNGTVYENRARKSEGFDIRALGGQVVAPGSIHPDTGKPYRIVDLIDTPIAAAPQWLLDLAEKKEKPASQPANQASQWDGDIDRLPISPETKQLIKEPIPVGGRSEAIMSVLNALVWANLSDSDIFSIFESYPIGEKYLEKGRSGHRWLQPQIDKARSFVVDKADDRPPLRAIDGGKAHQLEEAPPWVTEEPVVKPKFYRLTEIGNAERLVDLHGQYLRYCYLWEKWLVWDKTRWAMDTRGRIKRKAKDTIRRIYEEAGKVADEDKRKAIAKHAMNSERDAKIKAMLSLAESEPGIPVIPDELDVNPWLLNCLNGTLDLRTGELREHRREDLITKRIPVAYDPQALCPKWDGFLDRIMDGNENLIFFLQRAVGYSLTGNTGEQCLFFCYGTGANGKSTFLDTILTMVGDYGRKTDFATFLVARQDSIRNDIARLKGARFVPAIEVGDGKKLAEIIVKELTGGDTITARFLFKEFFEFKPQFKIWLAANHKPLIYGTDWAIWRRIRLIPFNVTIPEDERDPDLAGKLAEELPGILAWAVRGCLEWWENGLNPPQEVIQATDEYRDEMDVLSGFIDECCIINTIVKATAKDLYEAYEAWCEDNGESPIKKRTFGSKLKEKGFAPAKSGGKRMWRGVGLKVPEEK